jgi:hypothetical protein
MSDKKIRQLNVRLNQKNFAILEQISREINQSPSTVGSQIISQWVEFYYYKIHRGDVVLSRQILKKIISILDKSRIDEVSKFMARHIINEIRLQEGEVTYPVLTEHILKWNKGNGLQLNKIRHNDNQDVECLDVFISKHNLGCNWSELECKTYTYAFEMVKQNVMNSEYDEEMFCIKVINRDDIN